MFKGAEVEPTQNNKELPSDSFLFFNAITNELELRFGRNDREVLYSFFDTQHGFFYLLRYLLTRREPVTAGQLRSAIAKIEETAIFGTTDFFNRLGPTIQKFEEILQSSPLLQQIFKLHITTDRRKVSISLESAVQAELLYHIQADEVYVFGVPEIINSGQPQARFEKEEQAYALTALIGFLEGCRFAAQVLGEQVSEWASETALNSHLQSKGHDYTVQFLVRRFRTVVSAGADNLIEENEEDNVTYYRLNPAFTNYSKKRSWEPKPDPEYRPLALSS